MKTIVLCNIRSCYNVGAIVRSAEFFGIDEFIFIGVTPHWEVANDSRLPHVIKANIKAINKVALSNLDTPALYFNDLDSATQLLKSRGTCLIFAEQDHRAAPLEEIGVLAESWALFVGEETHGFTPDELNLADVIVEITKLGSKNSLNVSSATAVLLYGMTNRQ